MAPAKRGHTRERALQCDDTAPHLHVAPSAAEWRAAVEDVLQTTGYRNTAQRRLVLDEIAAQSAPFSAEALVTQLCTSNNNVAVGLGRATIYRTLEWLRELGWVTRLHNDNGLNTYARLLPGQHHSVVCTRCGAVLVLGGDLVEPVIDALLLETAFHVQGHMVEVYGLCATCHTD